MARVPVQFTVAVVAECYKICIHIRAALTSILLMVDLKMSQRSAVLTAPIVPLQYTFT
jgi:hypothetical protein